PNPAGVASPILSSILKVTLGADGSDPVAVQAHAGRSLHARGLLGPGTDERGRANRHSRAARRLSRYTSRSTRGDRPRDFVRHDAGPGSEVPLRGELGTKPAGQRDVDTGRWQTVVRFPRVPRVPPTESDTEADAVPTSAR